MRVTDGRSCMYCHQRIDGAYTMDRDESGDGYSHLKCYERVHTFVPKVSFLQVLVNLDDQVLVRELLEALVPELDKARIVQEFNRRMLAKGPRG